MAEQFGSLEKLKQAALEEIDHIPNIGIAVAKSVYDYFADKNNLAFIDRLLINGVKVKYLPQGIKKSGPLLGKKIVVTGTLDSMSRDEAKAAVRGAGGDWVSSVSKNTDLVIAGDQPGSKLDKAEKLNIKILDEKAFLQLLKK